MGKFKYVFSRYEKKYVVTAAQRDAFLSAVSGRIEPDKFGKSTLYNIYFDTPDYRLIRASIEKPVFKEKLRIRSYGQPTKQSNVFLEIKKKYKGIVYKRRINMPYYDAVNYVMRHIHPEGVDKQILSEIDYFLRVYPKIRPAASIFYDRTAYYSKEDSELRITFDSNIRFRTKDFDLAHGDYGYSLTDSDTYIMEIKCIGSMPLWLTHELDRLKIFPASFSKYGEAYKLLLSKRMRQTANV